MAGRKTKITCSFCGASSDEVEKMITGPGVYICNSCVLTCQDILNETGGESSSISDESSDDSLSLENLPTPREMKSFLDQYIVGQDEAKIGVVVAAYNHYKRLLSRSNEDDVEIEKSNVLLLGPTGTGKTLIAQSLARLMNVPFTIVDATVFTEAGYVGEDVENMLSRLLQAADNDPEKTQRGIIYIDEFDKIGRKGANASITRDVSGEGVQQSLLKILEGTKAQIAPKGGRKHPEQKLVEINTRDILFICGGAFVGLEQHIEKRTSRGGMGLTASISVHNSEAEDALLQLVQPEDLVHFGLIPELIGRIPAIFALNHLDADALLKILTEPRNALLKQYSKLIEMDGAELVFEEDALLEIVQIAEKKRTGARGLRAVVERAMTKVMYELPSREEIKEVRITKAAIADGAEPIFN